MRLNNLRLPFDVEISPFRGRCWLRGSSRWISLEAGRRVRVSAHRRFCMETVPIGGITGPAEAHAIHLAVSAPGRQQDRVDHRAFGNWSDEPVRPLSQSVARAVFSEPEAPWRRARAAETLGLSVRELSVRLFREGATLSSLIWEQRLMRALFDVSQGRGIRATHGFVSREQRDSAFYDCLGICVEEVTNIGRAGALRWFGAPF